MMAVSKDKLMPPAWTIWVGDNAPNHVTQGHM